MLELTTAAPENDETGLMFLFTLMLMPEALRHATNEAANNALLFLSTTRSGLILDQVR